MSQYKQTYVYNFPIREKYRNSQNTYWDEYKIPTIIKETNIITALDISQISPYKLSITSSKKSISCLLFKFQKSAYGGSFRKDGELIVSGCEDSTVRIFSILTKSQLREFKGHKKEVHVAKFTSDNFHVISGSDDKSLKYWDLATSAIVAEYEDHNDYIRAGVAMPSSSNLFMTGSYDHFAKIFDFRCPEFNRAMFKMDHTCPIESVLVLPNERIAFTAGGNIIKVWDIAQNRHEMYSFMPHSKTITALAYSASSNKLISGSLDRQVRIHNISTFETIHSHTYSDPVLSVAISPQDQFIAVGMVNGLVAIRRRRIEGERAKRPFKIFEDGSTTLPETRLNSIDEMDKDMLSLGDELGAGDDENSKKRMRSFDKSFKKFQFSQSFDMVFSKATPNHKSPHVIVSYLRELIRRNKVKAALAGREFDLANDFILKNFMEFLIRNLEDARFTTILIDVASILVDLYVDSLTANNDSPSPNNNYALTNAPVIEKLVQIVNRNVNMVKSQMCTLGVIDSLMLQNKLSQDLGNVESSQTESENFIDPAEFSVISRSECEIL